MHTSTLYDQKAKGIIKNPEESSVNVYLHNLTLRKVKTENK